MAKRIPRYTKYSIRLNSGCYKVYRHIGKVKRVILHALQAGWDIDAIVDTEYNRHLKDGSYAWVYTGTSLIYHQNGKTYFKQLKRSEW